MKFLKWLLICLAVVIYTERAPVTFRWTPGVGGGPVDHFELVLVRDGGGEIYSYGTQSTQITVSKPKSGKYEAKVRAVGYDQNGLPLNSAWCSSLDENCALLKTGQPGTWKIFWKPSSVIGPIIITPQSLYWNDHIFVDINLLIKEDNYG